MVKRFDVELLPDAVQFLEMMDEKPREKCYYNIRKSQYLLDNELFKKISQHIWEFRTLYQGKAYRLFAFWDNSKENAVLVIATHGIIKKTDKTPSKEIERAEKIRQLYLSKNR